MIGYIIAFGIGVIIGIGIFVFWCSSYVRSMTLKHRNGKHACNACGNFFAECLYEVKNFKYCPECGKELTYHTEVLKEMEEQAKSKDIEDREIFEEFEEENNENV